MNHISFIQFCVNADAYCFREELDELGGCEESSAVIDALLADALQCLEGVSATLVPRRPAGTGHRIRQLEIPGHSASALNDVAFDGNSHRRGCLSQTGESYFSQGPASQTCFTGLQAFLSGIYLEAYLRHVSHSVTDIGQQTKR